MNNWQPVYENEKRHRVEIVRAVLEDNHMNPVVLNQTISEHGLGTFEVRVAPDFVLAAIKLIKEDIKFE
ncbi:MAG: hypothetical protein ABJP45_17785 [Cyclobacteriaceae bacterium]